MSNYKVIHDELIKEQQKSIELRKLTFDGRITKEQRFKIRQEQNKHWKKRVFLSNLLKKFDK